MRDSELGFINRARDPDYRVFVTDTDLTLGGWTNRSGAEASPFEARGKFMGSGETVEVVAATHDQLVSSSGGGSFGTG